ncbi:SAV_915 family protein [Micromonospora sp. NPDC005367]|uniref:SAV_915 family protein n=1 Tax=Micromonospora sp. NPDC005367 TaxID=3155590 RepID=UPI0033B9BE74
MSRPAPTGGVVVGVELPDTYVVPVRTTPGRQALAVRSGRLQQGQRVGLAFTDPERLARAMGTDQPSIRLCESALRSMLRPLGIDRIQVDPLLVAPPVRPDAAVAHQPTALLARGSRERRDRPGFGHLRGVRRDGHPDELTWP